MPPVSYRADEFHLESGRRPMGRNEEKEGWPSVGGPNVGRNADRLVSVIHHHRKRTIQALRAPRNWGREMLGVRRSQKATCMKSKVSLLPLKEGSRACARRESSASSASLIAERTKVTGATITRADGEGYECQTMTFGSEGADRTGLVGEAHAPQSPNIREGFGVLTRWAGRIPRRGKCRDWSIKIISEMDFIS